MSETASVPPPVAIGHMALTVADLGASHDFYAAFGLRPLMKDAEMAIFELRGGTHLLLFQRGGAADDGASGSGPAEAIDLMIAGRGFAELDAFRAAVTAAGVKPEPIPDQRRYGHYLFTAHDPDGNEVTVFTSHASDQPI